MEAKNNICVVFYIETYFPDAHSISLFDDLWHSETVCLAKCAWLLPWYSTNHVTPLSGAVLGKLLFKSN